MSELSALKFYRIRRRLRFAENMLIALRNDIGPIDRGCRDALENARQHIGAVETLWERNNKWKHPMEKRA